MSRIVNIPIEMAELLQRYMFDINTRKDLVCRMFKMYENDETIFDSKPWKKYYGELEENEIKYDEARRSLESYIINKYKIKHFNWEVVDFENGQVKVEDLDA